MIGLLEGRGCFHFNDNTKGYKVEVHSRLELDSPNYEFGVLPDKLMNLN